LTPAELDRVFQEALRHVALTREQRPMPRPATPDEVRLSRLD
jgi:hypothetical protein